MQCAISLVYVSGVEVSVSIFKHIHVHGCLGTLYVHTLCRMYRLFQFKNMYSETSLIRHSMGPENNVGLRGCWIMKCFLPYLCMVTIPHIMVGLERMLDYRGVGLARFHCIMLYCWSSY